jgi:hypothetical protein
MSEDAINSTPEYIETIAQTLRNSECTDSKGNPIREFLPAEFVALSEFLLNVVKLRGATLRCALELSGDDRKHVVVYAGILSIIEADARRTGRKILFLSPDSTSEAAAELEYRAMWPFTTSKGVEFSTWDNLQPKPENGFRLADLGRFWVIGDLDWSGQPHGGNIGDLKVTAVKRVLADGACPALLLHQQGKIPVIPFPPTFGTRPAAKGGCFIATAACGSPLVVEVVTLQEFRDRVLVPTPMGRLVINAYKRFSPPIARWIKRHPIARMFVRNILIRPAARTLNRRQSIH